MTRARRRRWYRAWSRSRTCSARTCPAGSLLQAALDSLDGVAGADRERARLGSAMAAAYLVDDRLDEAIAYGEASRAESQRLGDEEAALNIAATLGSVLVFAGRMEEGWRLLQDAIARATGAQQEAEAARGYRMIGSSASALVEYDLAERWLPEGIGYAEKVELWNHRHYMASHLAHVQWATGQWQAAARTAQQALADGRGGLTTQITAQFVLGYLAMGAATGPSPPPAGRSLRSRRPDGRIAAALAAAVGAGRSGPVPG